MDAQPNLPKQPSLVELIAALPEAERTDAEDRVARYLEVAVRIYESACADPARYALLQQVLTDARENQYHAEKGDDPPNAII